MNQIQATENQNLNYTNSDAELSMIKENMVFAKKLANRFYQKRSHSQAEIEDLISSAYLGLCEAAKRYDIDRSDNFKSYSFLRIRGSMYEYLKLSGGISRSSYKKLKSNTDHSQFLTRKENAFGFSASKMSDLNALVDSLGISIHYDKTNNEYEISYSKQDLAETILEQEADKSSIEHALDSLPKDIARIVKAKYFEEKSLAELQEEFPQHSKSHLSRLHAKGLRLLRQNLAKTIQ
jgi:RNA polymerase sigma factor (sigma-70 family)